MMIRTLILCAVLLAGVVQECYAATTSSFAYNRTAINIIRKAPPTPPSLPWLPPNPPEAPATRFEVEVREATAFYNQQGWFNLNDQAEGSGVLITFATPRLAPVTHSTQYAPFDVLLADSQGKITQIIPNIRLSELNQDIVPVNPVLAFLFLRGGTCALRSINPGDTIEYSAFRKSPALVLDAPLHPPVAPAAKPVTPR